MKKLFSIMLLMLLTSTLTLTFNVQLVKANPTTIIVPDDYPTIQEAVSNANEGDIIFVRTGTYFENIVVNKSVSLVGENRENTIIDGQRINTVIYVNASYVTITNFTVQNGAGFNGRPYAGISAYDSSHLNITYNIIKNNIVGIDCEIGSGGNCITILNNVIISSVNGIGISNYNNVTIANNTIIAYNLGLYIGGGNFHRISNNIIFCENKGLELSWIKNSTVVCNNVTAYGGTVLKLYHSNECLIATNLISGGKSRNNGDHGIYLYSSNENAILHNGVSMCKGNGINIFDAENNTISNNTITQCSSGLFLYSSKYNSILKNRLSNNSFAGLSLFQYSDRNVLVNNNVSYNEYGIYTMNSWYNVVYHNNFIDNSQQVYDYSWDYPEYPISINSWDDGYPSGGNFWSDYTGVDNYSGPYQNETGSDGVGDSPYFINADNQDRYPLMGPLDTFDAGVWKDEPQEVYIVSNSTISNFQLNAIEKIVSFNVTGVEGTVGFCRVNIPNIIVDEFWDGDYSVLIDGRRFDARKWTDIENTYIYFAYNHSEHKVTILQTFNTTLQITATAGGTTHPSPGIYNFTVGSSAEVMAIPEVNYKLAYWELDGINICSVNPIEVLMDANHTLQAVFTQITYQLTIQTTTGGTTNPQPGTYTYVNGTQVTVTALPNTGFSFNYWLLNGEIRTENPITIIMDANHSLEAYFIDDIPPEISEPWQNPTPDDVQPFQNVTVWVNVTDYGTGIKNVTLWYSLNNGTSWTVINMTALPIPSDATITYEATIPGYENCTWVTYKIIAYDNAGNNSTKDNNGYGYKYHVIPEYSTTIIMPLFMTLSAIAIVFAKKKTYKKTET